MKNRKLELTPKILLATGAINYMAQNIGDLQTTAYALDGNPIGIIQREEALTEALSHLLEAMEVLGNYMNASDAQCTLDGLILDPAFQVLLQGKDEPERLSFYEVMKSEDLS